MFFGSGRRQSVWLVSALLLGLVSAIGLSPWSPSAWAEDSSSDPGDVRTLCESGSADGLREDNAYMGVYMPAGAKAHFVASGTVSPAPYGPPGFEAANGYLWLKASVGGGTVYTRMGGTSHSGMDLPSSIPFTSDLGSWTNTTGSNAPVGIQMWADPQAGPGWGSISWSVQVEITGGTPGTTCQEINRSELNGPNEALGQQCPSCHGSTDYSVDSLTGNEHWTLPGARLNSRGPGVDFRLAHNSSTAATNGPIGYGWSHSYDMSLGSGDFGTKVVTQETGATVPFVQVGEGSSVTWVAPGKFDATLVQNADGTWLFTRHRREFFTFDATGRLLSIADRNGYATTLSYGADGLDHVVDDAGHRLNYTWVNGRVATVTDVSDAGKPRQMRFEYDTSGNLITFTDVGDGPWSMTYDGSHRLKTVQSPRLAGTTAVREFHYDAQGRVDWEEDPLDRRTTLYYNDPVPGATRIVDPAGDARVDYYNGSGQRTSVTSGYGTPDASTTQYQYDAATGMVTKLTDGRGKEWVTAFEDPANPFSPTRTTDPMGRVRTMSYTTQGDLDLLTDAHGSKTKYTYDTNGNAKTTTVAYGSPAASTAEYFYADAAHPGQPTSLVDSRGKTWLFDHKPATGELTKSTDPLGNATTWTYNPEGWVETRVDPRGNVPGANPADYTTTYQYNAFGQPKLVTDALGHQTQIDYDADGNRTFVTDPTNRVVEYTWTPAGELESVIRGPDTATEQTLTYTYWPDGNLKTRSYSPESTWSLTWDAQDRLSQEIDPDGRVTTHTYDQDGRPTSLTTGAGSPDASTTGYTYDADGRLETTTVGQDTPAAITSTTAYDITVGTAPCTGGPSATAYCVSEAVAGRSTVRFYDAKDQLIQTRRPGGKTTSATYDPAGAVKTTTDPSGVQTTYTYDDAGRLVSKSLGTAADDVTYTYWPNGQRKTMTDATGTTTYDYDRTGALTSVLDGAQNRVGYNPDSAGRPGTMTYPSGRIVSYQYDGAGQMSSLTDSVTGQVTTFGYDPLGSLESTSLPSGDTITTTPTDAGLPDDITLKDSAGTALAGIDYGYDDAGRIERQANSGALSGTTTYDYDPLGQLKSATDPATGTTTSYGFDAAGNPTTLGPATQTFDGSDQLQTQTAGAGTTTYNHDGNGNRATVSPTSRTGSSFKYDRSGRMVSATSPRDDGSLYNPVPASRLLDTRNGTGTCTPSPCAKIPAGGTLTLQVGGKGGVPSTGAHAVVLSVTALNSTADGSVIAYPTGATKPGGRSMSVVGGQTITNTVVTGVSDTGQVTFYSGVAADVLVEVSGWYAAPGDGTGSAFRSLNTHRILDTRNATGACTPSPCARLATDETTTVQVGGEGGVPATGVTAVAYTLTAFTPANNGSATTWSATDSQPTVRNLTFVSGSAASNLVVSQLSTQGKLKLNTTKAADFTLDVAGYYTTSADGTGNIFVPYTSGGAARRILDTRDGTGECSPSPCGKLLDNGPLTATVAGRGQVPADATKVVATATAWNPTGDGGLVAWPAGATKPAGRNLSYGAGTTTSGTLQTDLSAQGEIKVESLNADTHVTLDIDGWFISAGETTTYTYNGDGIRAAKTDPNGNTTRFTYDTSQPVPQLLTDGTTDYIYGPEGAPLASLPSAGSSGPTSYYMTDALGSTTALTGTTGAVTGTYAYTPFGQVSTHTGIDTPLQYGGGYADAETGLTYLLARYYDPATGLFTTPDPLLDLTNQPYAYAGNDPINQTDPTGQCPWCVIAGGAILGGGIDLGIQVADNLSNGCPAFYNISWGEVAASAAAGAAFDGLGYAAFKAAAIGLRSTGLAAKTAALTEREIGTAVDDVLQGATFFKQSQATQYLKSGGFGQANADFDALTKGVKVIERGGGLRTATLSNGTKINVRPFSSGKYPTLEIDTPGNPALKIRY